jgi:hypothetical protein
VSYERERERKSFMRERERQKKFEEELKKSDENVTHSAAYNTTLSYYHSKEI